MLELCNKKYQQIFTSSRSVMLGEIIDIFNNQRIPLSSRERKNLEKIYRYYGATGILDHVDNYIFSGNYILMAEDGTVMDESGFPIVQYVNGKFWVNNHAHILQGKNGVTNATLYLILKNTPVRELITGAVQLKINQTNLCKLNVSLPIPSILESFNVFVQPFFDKIESLWTENEKLIKFKGLYLKKFFN